MTFQFLVAAILLTSTGVVYQQLDHVRTKDLGIDCDDVLTIWVHNREVTEKIPSLREAFLADPRVTGFTVTSTVPTEWMATGVYSTPGQSDEREADLLGVDSHVVEFYGLDLLAGRTFDDDLESGACLINGSLMRDLGYAEPEHAIGAPIHWRSPEWTFHDWATREPYDSKDGVVIGVVDDFHYRSLHSPIQPTILFTEISMKRMMTIRVASGDVPGAMGHMEQAWNRIVPSLPFNPEFLDERFAMAYRAEDRLGQTVGTFATLAVFVTCLGVFGLGAFTISRRTKEIGVRKCLGASTPGIVLLLSAEPVRLAVLACLAAAPITWLVMDRWLQAFSYRIQLGPVVFLLAACGVLFVAWLAVAPLAGRAARTAPVKALRYE